MKTKKIKSDISLSMQGLHKFEELENKIRDILGGKSNFDRKHCLTLKYHFNFRTNADWAIIGYYRVIIGRFGNTYEINKDFLYFHFNKIEKVVAEMNLFLREIETMNNAYKKCNKI